MIFRSDSKQATITTNHNNTAKIIQGDIKAESVI